MYHFDYESGDGTAPPGVRFGSEVRATRPHRTVAEPCVVLVVDGDGTVATASPGLESLLGYDRHDVVGQPVGRLLPGGDAAPLWALNDRSRRADRTVAGEVIHRDADGVDRALPVAVHARVVPDGVDGTDPGFVEVIHGAPAPAPAADGRYETLARLVDDPFLLVDVDRGVVRDASEAACRLLERDRATLRRLPVDRLVAVGDRAAFGALLGAVADGDDRTGEVSFAAGGGTVDAEVTAGRVEVGGRPHAFVVVGDTAERRDDRRERERRALAVEAATDGIAVLDDEFRYEYVNPAYAAAYGYEPSTLVGEHWDVGYDDEQARRLGERFASTLVEQGWWVGDAAGRRADGSRFPQRLSVAAIADGGYVCVLRDASERDRLEGQFAALTDAIREFAATNDVDDLLAAGIDAAVGIGGRPVVWVQAYDPDRDALVPRAASRGAREVFDGDGPIDDASTTSAGHAFVDGEAAVHVVHDEAAPIGRLSQVLSVPLGGFGLLRVGTSSDRGFDRSVVRTLEALGEALAASLARARRVADLRAANAALVERCDALAGQVATRDAAGAMVAATTRVVKAVATASTRAAIERAACEALVDTPLYDLAWVSGPDGGTGEEAARSLRVAAGLDAATDVTTDADGDAGGDGRSIAAAAAARGESVVATGADLPERLDESVRVAGLARGVEAAAAVPVGAGDLADGALAVATGRADAFEPAERRWLESIAALVRDAVRGDRYRRLLLADRVVRFDLRVNDDAFLARATATLDATLDVVGVTQSRPGGPVRYYTCVEAGDPAAVLAWATDSPAVDDADLLDDGGRRPVVVVSVPAAGSLAAALFAAGGRVTGATAGEGSGRLVGELPSRAAVREFLAGWRADADAPSVEVVAIRDRSTWAESDLHRAVVDDLTDRQREVLETAYGEGYFDWPRRHTAQEVAVTLDIAPSTLHQHLRLAERKIVRALVDPSPRIDCE